MFCVGAALESARPPLGLWDNPFLSMNGVVQLVNRFPKLRTITLLSGNIQSPVSIRFYTRQLRDLRAVDVYLFFPESASQFTRWLIGSRSTTSLTDLTWDAPHSNVNDLESILHDCSHTLLSLTLWIRDGWSEYHSYGLFPYLICLDRTTIPIEHYCSSGPHM